MDLGNSLYELSSTGLKGCEQLVPCELFILSFSSGVGDVFGLLFLNSCWKVTLWYIMDPATILHTYFNKQ